MNNYPNSTRTILIYTKARKFIIIGLLLRKRDLKKERLLRRFMASLSTLLRLNLNTKMQLALPRRRNSSEKGLRESLMK